MHGSPDITVGPTSNRSVLSDTKSTPRLTAQKAQKAQSIHQLTQRINCAPLDAELPPAAAVAWKALGTACEQAICYSESGGSHPPPPLVPHFCRTRRHKTDRASRCVPAAHTLVKQSIHELKRNIAVVCLTHRMGTQVPTALQE
eukprot:179693-Rhodomonas_salina.1